MENENEDPVGQAPRKVFANLAARAGLIKPGDPLDENLAQFAFMLVARCAGIGDRYGDGECGGDAGEYIRAELGE